MQQQPSGHELVVDPLSDQVNRSAVQSDLSNAGRAIALLEQELTALLSSRSWTVTRVFRDIHRAVRRIKPVVHGAALREAERFRPNSPVDAAIPHQQIYLQHLQDQLRRVKTSRSWRMMSILRLLKRVAGGLIQRRIGGSACQGAMPFHGFPSTPVLPPLVEAQTPSPPNGDGATESSAVSTEPLSKESSVGERHLVRDGFYDLAIATQFRDDAQYLQEWINFHRVVGVQHFYLFNNLSSDNYAEVLAPFVAEGLVDLIEWPFAASDHQEWIRVQRRAFERARQLTLGKARWVAFIDVDEFLFPVREDSLVDVLGDYGDKAGVGVNWRFFGTSAVERISQDKLMIESLTKTCKHLSPHNRMGKYVARPEAIEEILDSHFFLAKPGYTVVNPEGLVWDFESAARVATDRLRINHYWCRDQWYFRNFKIPRVVKAGFTAQDCERNDREFNEVEDTAILRFVPKLRELMSAAVSGTP